MLKEAIKKRNISMYKLSQKSGVGYATIYEMCNGKRKDIMLETAVRIGNELNISADEIYYMLKAEADKC